MPKTDKMAYGLPRGAPIVYINETGRFSRQLTEQDHRESLVHQCRQLFVVRSRARKYDPIYVFSPDQVNVGVRMADVFNRFEE